MVASECLYLYLIGIYYLLYLKRKFKKKDVELCHKKILFLKLEECGEHLSEKLSTILFFS